MLKGRWILQSHAQLEMLDLTEQVYRAVRESGVAEGLCFLYNPHTTAGLVINEGADPDVQRDILGMLAQIVPSSYPYRHREGNSLAHLMATLTGASLTVPIEKGQVQLGTWQRIFFCEFDGPRQRTVQWKILAG